MTDVRKCYSEDIKNINSITFSLFTNQNIKLNSCIQSNDGINISESYENFEPKKNGLVDLALGTSDIYLTCTTCGGNSMECPGHFGHTELLLPVFHLGFFNHLKNILQCICIKCSKLLIKLSIEKINNILEKQNENRFKEIKSLIKTTTVCSHCNTPVPKIKREVKEHGTIKILLEYFNISETFADADRVFYYQNAAKYSLKIKSTNIQ